ncbi:MAG TPA: sensor histidine kinase [Chthoniobacterales bacterium]|nr:sensor histidine kinase [Chthoniobacterales bacterium]
MIGALSAATAGLAYGESPPEEQAFGIRLFLDEQLMPDNGPLVIPYGPHHLVFRVLTSRKATEYGVKRIRTRLDERDHEWVEPPSEMSIALRFTDEAKAQVSTESYSLIGKSPGWKGSFAKSKFTHRSESVQVPDGAAYLNIVVSSAGPPTAVGLLAVTNLTVQSNTSPPLSLKLFPDPAGDTVAPDKLTNWLQNGMKFKMARLLATDASPGHPALTIEDNDAISHAEWGLRVEAFIQVKSGSRLQVSWDELYSSGEGTITEADLVKLPLDASHAGQKFAGDKDKPDYAWGPKAAEYRDLAPGTYSFRVQGLDWLGNPLPIETAFHFAVEPPFWKRPIFIGGCVMAAAILVMLALRRRSTLRTRRQMEQMRQDHLLETERLRIARNIHDDLGARLTHISLVSENVRRAGGISPEAEKGFETISRMTRDLVGSLYETIWTVDPQNDNLESLLDFVCETVQKLCESAGIRCKISLPESAPGFAVSSDMRHNLILAIKEAVNNAVRHSGASCIELNASFAYGRFVIEVSDDGKGFDPDTIIEGYGLANLHKRMKDLGGECLVERRQPQGTRVILEAPLGGPELPGG